MNHPSNRRSQARVRGSTLGGVLLPIFLFVVAAVAARTHAQNATAPITLPLEYRELKQGYTYLGLAITPQPTPFAKEPDLGARTVRRGTFTLGPEKGLSTRFIWDYTQRRLYLDLNRNEDLTDDTNGVFNCTTDVGTSDRRQQFSDLLLVFPVHGVPHPLRFDFDVYSYGGLSGSMQLRSYWSAKLTLQEREWEIGILPDLNRRSPAREEQILLRPWSAHEEAFSSTDGTLTSFNVSSNLFLQDRAFGLEWKASTNAPVQFTVELTPQQPALGELQLPGQHINRALLKDGPWTVVLDQPTNRTFVPVGTYPAHAVHLRTEKASARLETNWPEGDAIRKPITVQTDQAVALAAGGPLTNSVTVQRRGQSMALQYRLVGAGGESYRALRLDPNDPPRFTIFLGDKEVASGKFEFG